MHKLMYPTRICFVIMPFGPGFDDRFKTVYAPAINDAGLQPLRADSLSKPSSIIEDIWRSIKQSVLLLADLTGQNPNVFYELGLAHAIGKPAVLILEPRRGFETKYPYGGTQSGAVNSI